MPVIKPVNGKNHDNWPSCSKMNKAGTSLWIKKNLRGTQSYTSQVLSTFEKRCSPKPFGQKRMGWFLTD